MMNNLFRPLKAAIVALPIAVAGFGAAEAAPVLFFGEGAAAATARANFLAALSAGVSTENFESIAAGTGASFGISFTGGLGTINATLNGSAVVSNFPNAGRFASSGSNYVETSPGFNVDFSGQSIAAFGFFATDIGDLGGQLSLVLDLAGGGTANLVVPHTLGSGGSTSGLLFSASST